MVNGVGTVRPSTHGIHTAAHTWQTSTCSHAYLLSATFWFSRVVHSNFFFHLPVRLIPHLFTFHFIRCQFVYSAQWAPLFSFPNHSLIVCERTNILHSQIGIIDSECVGSHGRWAQTDNILFGSPFAHSILHCSHCHVCDVIGGLPP